MLTLQDLLRTMTAPNYIVLYKESVSYTLGKLYGSAVMMADGIRLTPAVGGQTGYYVYTPPTLNYSAFYIRFYFRTGLGNGADAVWVGLFDNTYSGTREDIVSNGYHFTYDEYQSRVAFTKSVVDNGPPICYASVSRSYLMDYNWHRAEVIFDRSRMRAKIYLDGILRVDCVDTLYGQANMIAGIPKGAAQGTGLIVFGGRTGGLYNEHWIKDILVVAFPQPVNIDNIPAGVM
jgi:hypothetical protein